jgi:hypothetical protein
MEVFSVLDGGDLESIRDAAEPVFERTNLEKLSVASFTALGTPEMFTPVGDNHAELSPTVIIVRDYPAANGGLSEQFLDTSGFEFTRDRAYRHILTCPLGPRASRSFG